MGLEKNNGNPPYMPGKSDLYRRLEEMRTRHAVQEKEFRNFSDSLRATQDKALMYELAETLARYANEIADEAEKEQTYRETQTLIWDYSRKLCDVVPNLSDMVHARGEWAKK